MKEIIFTYLFGQNYIQISKRQEKQNWKQQTRALQWIHTFDSLMLVLLIAASTHLLSPYIDVFFWMGMPSGTCSTIPCPSSEGVITGEMFSTFIFSSRIALFLRSSIAEDTADGKKSFPLYKVMNSLSLARRVAPVKSCREVNIISNWHPYRKITYCFHYRQDSDLARFSHRMLNCYHGIN